MTAPNQVPDKQAIQEQATIAYLRQPQTIRERCHQLFDLCQANELEHFACDLSQLDTVASYVVETTQQLYPDFDVPFHSRWRHLAVAGAKPDQGNVRSQLDLAIISVLLDAGAGSQWRYQDAATNQVLGRSEGLAIASLRAFEQGLCSSDPGTPKQVDAKALQAVTEADLADAFQVSDDNPLVGLQGRLTLLHQLGATLAAQPLRFGTEPARPGNLFDYWQNNSYVDASDPTLEASFLLTEVLESFSAIWPGRVTIGNTNLGDVWPHPALPTTELVNTELANKELGSHLVPFHKLSQWLTYSLVEPLVAAGINVTHLNHLTGLAEYRNGGLCVDLGLLMPKHPAVTEQTHLPSSSVVVEWRALTVVLLDLIGEQVQQRLNKTPDELPLIKVLEGGTWTAGRRIAKQLRADGTPPIKIQSDGTVF